VIEHLKQIGRYDNTLIVFTSDNAGSEPVQFPLGGAFASAVNKTALPSFFKNVNNTLPNLGNSTSSINYGAWGSYLSVAPLSCFKASLYEGGIRPPFIVKEPSSTIVSTTTTTTASPSPSSSSSASSSNGNNASSVSNSPTTAPNTTTNKIIKGFVFVTDITPTILDYAKVSQAPAGSIYKGNQTHPIMGKSIKPLLNGTVDRVHGPEEPIGTEMFNSTGLYMGDWMAIWDGAHPTGKWQLYNLVNDPGQNNNVADQNQDLLQKMIAAYQNYSKEVGIVSHLVPPMNKNQTVQLNFILPEQLKAAIELVANGTFSLDI
jgi:arylsulfatase A-like enzyme